MRVISVCWFLIIFLSLGLVEHLLALECWTCVGTDCDATLENSKFAYKTECEPGAQCQKTYFYYYNYAKNTSERIGPIRSCSYSTGCAPIDEFASGMCDNWRFYQSLGCVKRYCCASDLCNVGNSKRSACISVVSSFAIFTASFLTVY